MTNPTIQQEIAKLVAASAEQAPTPAAALNPRLANVQIEGDTTGAIRYNSATGVTEQLTQPTAPPSGRVHDNGVDTRAEAARLQSQLSDLQSRLDAAEFNKENGAKEYRLTGSNRVAVQKQLDQMKQTAAFQLSQWQALEAQRAADRAAAQSARERELFTLGDPRRAAMLNEEIEREQARQLAQRIVAGKAK